MADGQHPAISVPSFVLCVVLVVSYVRAFHEVAIPQSGMLAQVRTLWLDPGHSGPILKKHCSPRLPAQPPLASGGFMRLHCFSAGGVTVGLIICWFYFSSLLCCPLCFQGSPQTRQRECFLVFGNFSVFKTPFPGQDSLPGTELPPYLLCLFFCLLYFFLPVFEDNNLLFWVPDVLCQHSEVVLWNLLSVEMFF